MRSAGAASAGSPAVSMALLAVTLWLCVQLLAEAGANNEHHAHSLSVTAPHVNYICPEGANVTLVCTQSGALAHPNDHLKQVWLYTPHMDQRCHDPYHPRNQSHAQRVVHNAQHSSFSITLLDVRKSDQGRYCCLALDFLRQGKHDVQQSPHSHMMLTIGPRRNGSLTCTEIDMKPPQGSVAAGLATAACIMGILCLPVLLVLVYRQRRTQGSRRAQELVRMDSEAQGHENPSFTGGSPQPKGRTISQILTRQSSESGLHLLSHPGTPFSPSTPGDVFFPANDPIPESPNFQEV